MTTIKITGIQDPRCIALPEDLLEYLGVEIGGTLYVSKSKHGIELTTEAPELKNQLEVAEEVMSKRYDILKKLAE